MMDLVKNSPNFCKISLRSLWIVLFLMFCLGFTAFYSASFYVSQRILNDPNGFFIRQFIWAILGFILLVVAYNLKLSTLRESLPYFFIITLLLMIISFSSSLGENLQGARRWVFIGNISIQPSELVKIFLVLYLSHFFSKYNSSQRGGSYWLVPFCVTSLFLILTLFQNDYSTTIFISLVVFSIIWVVGIPYRYILLLTSLALPIFIFTLLSEPYRLRRIFIFLNPYADLSGSGYQFIMARKALQNGGFWGMGMGESLQKMGRLPESYADYVFAIFSEEFGFLGVLGFLCLFSYFAYLGYRVALCSQDSFKFLLAFGITTLIFLQALMNVSIVSGLLPPTGIPLPFFSSGGSHLVVTLFCYGLLLNIAKDIKS